MSEINYVIRENGISKLFIPESDSDYLVTTGILKDYPYLVDSIVDESYVIVNNFCTRFDEIIFENKVVGFVTCEFRNNSQLLTECFILPEYRGNGLFFNELCKLISQYSDFGILQPNCDIVKRLIDYSFAIKVNRDITASSIDFYFNENYAHSSKDRNLDYKSLTSNFYDLSINSAILVCGDEVIYQDFDKRDLSEDMDEEESAIGPDEMELIGDLDEEELIIGLDENELTRELKQKELPDDYFDNIKELFSKRNDDLKSLVADLKKKLPEEKLGYDVIIGSNERLSEFMQDAVDEGCVSYDRIFEIKRQLIREYESGEIDDESIEKRFNFLISREMPASIDLEEFCKFLNSTDEEDMHELKNFFDIFKDNKELCSNIFNALINRDEEKFNDLIADDGNSDLFDLNPDCPFSVCEMMWGPEDVKYKLDDTVYGKDYPICYDVYIFRMLNSIKERNSLKVARKVADIKGALDFYVIVSFLFDNDFITNWVTYDNWEEFANDQLTVPELKDFLRENNSYITGFKPVLIDRIAENQLPLDKFKYKKVRITPAGEEFLKNNSWINFYEDYLGKFDFNDYVRFLENNDGDLKEVILDYLNKHFNLAKRGDDPIYLWDCTEARELISKIDKKYFEDLQ